MNVQIMEAACAAAAGPQAAEDGPGLGLPFEAHLNPMELKLAHKMVAGLAPCDPQEEMHAWHMAVSHILSAQRFGKSRQEGLSERAGQIEIGLAVRLMALADRKSASLDRHRAFRLKAADEAEQRARVRAYQEAEAAKRAAEDAKQAEWAARRRRYQKEQEEQERLEADGQEEPEAAGGEPDTAPPTLPLSEAEATADGSPAPGSERDP